MLVISRKPGEALLIGDNIRISIISCGQDKVTIGIDAPKDIKLTREELLDTINANKASIGKIDSQNYKSIAALIKNNSLDSKK